MVSLYWLAVFIALAVVEMATLSLTTIWFAGGAFVALLLSLFGTPLWLEMAVFVVTSFGLLFLTRPFALNCVNGRTVRTNAESLIGRQVLVKETIENTPGRGTAEVDGMDWMARSLEPDEVIEAGERVYVRKIEGVRLIVSRKEEDA